MPLRGEGRRFTLLENCATLAVFLLGSYGPYIYIYIYVRVQAMMGSNRADNAHRRMVPQDFHRLLPFSFLRLLVEFCSPPRQTMKLDRSVRIDWSILYDSLRSYNAAALLPLTMSISIRDERSHVQYSVLLFEFIYYRKSIYANEILRVNNWI